MAYDDIRHLCVTLPLFDFGGTADEIMSFRLPTGWKARLVKIGVAIVETFACTSTVAMLQLGTTASNTAYAKLEIADTTADEDFFDETDDTNAILEDDIAANTLLEVGMYHGQDTSLAGQGYPMLFFELYE